MSARPLVGGAFDDPGHAQPIKVDRQKFQPLWRIHHLPPFQTGIRHAKLEPTVGGARGELLTVQSHINDSNASEDSLAVLKGPPLLPLKA
jgi:hypothetical protein